MSAPRFFLGCFLVCLVILAASTPARGQTATCIVTVWADTQNRIVLAPNEGVHINAECPGSIHTYPFGNWGVSSNVGERREGMQFPGWGPPWVQDGGHWNSCTSNNPPGALYDCPPLSGEPPCEYYNYNVDPATGFYTQQVTIHGIKSYGGAVTLYSVSCPRFYSDGSWRRGCEDLITSYGLSSNTVFTLSQNYATLYELDPWDNDELIQSLYFPDRSVNFSGVCNVWSCQSTASPFADPISYDSPVWPPLVYAQMGISVGAELLTSAPYGDCDQWLCGPCNATTGWCPPCIPRCFIGLC